MLRLLRGCGKRFGRPMTRGLGRYMCFNNRGIWKIEGPGTEKSFGCAIFSIFLTKNEALVYPDFAGTSQKSPSTNFSQQYPGSLV